MSNLNSIVDVQISIQNSVVQATQFDLILVLGIHKVFPELFREYTSASDMLTDGFLATSPEYYAAVAIFSQTPTVNRIYIGRRASNYSIVSVDSAVDNTAYFVNVNGNIYNYTSKAAPTTNSIVAGLVAACGTDAVANATNNLNGTYDLRSKISSVPYTLLLDVNQAWKSSIVQNEIVTAIDNTDYTIIINGTSYTYHSTVAATKASIAAGLCAAGAGDPTVNFIDNLDGTYAVEAKINGTFFDMGTDINQSQQYNWVRMSIDNVVPNFNYYAEIANIQHLYNSGDTATKASIAAGLCAAGAGDPTVNFVDNLDGTYIIDNKVDGTVFTLFTDARQSFASGPAQSIDLDLTAIQTVDNSWYGFLETTHEAAIQAVAATWSEANEKLFGLMSNDPKIINEAPSVDTTSIAAVLKAMNYHRSFCIYEQTADLYGIDSDSAWMGLEFAKQPGQSTWAWKTLAGIEADALTSTQIANCKGKRGNCYHTIAGVDVTDYGTVFDNKYVYIDIVRGIDWLKNTIQTSLWGVLTSMDKIPYTDAGINILAGYLRKTLMAAVANGILSDNPAPIVTAPKAADVPIVDKQDRILRNLNFTAILAGAIQKVQIRGTVSF